MMYDEEMKQFVKRKETLRINLNNAYSLIWGQCTKGMKNRLESRKEWNSNDGNQIRHNAISLLKMIKEITHHHQDNRYPMESIFQSLASLVTCKQENGETLPDFTKRFNTVVDLFETLHGPLAMTAYMRTRDDYANVTDQAEQTKILKEQYERLLAYIYLRALNTKGSGKLVEDLGNQFALGQNNFPASITNNRSCCGVQELRERQPVPK